MDRFSAAGSPTLVGRVAERTLLEAFPSSLGDGPAALLLLGEAGIGKTSLWWHGIRAADQDMTVLVARPSEVDRHAAFSGLAELFEGLDEEMKSLSSPARLALARAVRREPGHGSLDPSAVAMAAAEVLGLLSARRPVVVAIDDLPWLDPSSSRVVVYALRRLWDRRLGLLASQRGHDIPDAIRSALPDDRVRRIDVAGLDVDEVAELIQRKLGATFLRPMTARIQTASNGNPFYALELARTVLQHRGPVSSHGPLPVPPTLSDLVGRRLASVPAATREALLLTAMAKPATLTVLATVAGPHVMSALQRGVDAGLVVFEGGQVRFTHPLLAETSYAQADPARRRRLHRALAGATDDVEVKAGHLAAGTDFPDKTVAEVLEAAAVSAGARGATEAAAEFFTAAGKLTPDDDVSSRLRRLLAGARQYVLVGQSVRAEEILRTLATVAPRGPRRAEVLQRIGMLERATGSWSQALGTLRDALNEAGEDHQLRARLEQAIAVAAMQAGDLRLAEGHVRSAETLAGRGVPETTAADVEVVAIMHEAASGGCPRAGRPARLFALGSEANQTPRMDEDFSMRVVEAAATLKWIDEFAHARVLLDELVDTLWNRQEDGLLMPPLFQLCELECWSGRLDRARDLARLAQQTCHRAGLPATQAMFLHAHALLAARAGDLEAARQAAYSCRVEATRSGDVRNLMRALAVQGFVDLSAGSAADAIEPLEESWQLQQDCGYGNPAVIRSAADHVESLLLAGRAEDAADLLEDVEGRAQRTGSRWAAMAAARCHGMIAAHRGDLVSARKHLEASLAQPQVGDPVEHGRSLLALAVVQRRSNQRATARATGQRALASFDQAQAAAWAEQARAELGRLNGNAATMNGLTRMETEVAQLIANGHTNNEISAQLYVSPKTVEAHLTHIYRKLGLRSRTELARHVTAQREPAVPRGIPDADQARRDLP